MADRTDRKQSLRPAKRLKRTGSSSQRKPSNSTVASCSRALPNSSSDRINNTSGFSPELSILSIGSDIRFNITVNGRPERNPERSNGIIPHQASPALAYFEPSCPSVRSSNSSRDNGSRPSTTESSELPSISNDCSSFLDNIRTTAGERSFLRNLLNLPTGSKKTSGADEGADCAENPATKRPLSEYDPFILGGQPPDGIESFLAF